MRDIPAHLQIKFEQRWAARFVTSAESATPQKQWPEKYDRPVAAPGKRTRETRSPSISGRFMARRFPSILSTIFVVTTTLADADARSRSTQDPNLTTPIEGASPTLAPFQHVRFCLRYPSDCKSNPADNDRIDLNTKISAVLKRVNHTVNMSIVPTLKSYGSNLGDGWTVAPGAGDCNDYAVTKRHELLKSGLPSKALRLSVVTTQSGIGHLVLVIATTKGDLVLDNLTEAIRPWQNTDYHWLKIQSATDAKFWYEVKAVDPSIVQADQRVRLADR
jgi:predicted transglutaminase-like cysteine proteinase